MRSPDVIEFEILLAPIAPDAPTGSDPRQDPSIDSPYRTIKTARADARSEEAAAIWSDSASGRLSPPSSWQVVLDQGSMLLSTVSKDSEVAAWVLEALVRHHGFTGLRDGLRLCREMVQQYWDGLYPAPGDEDEDDIDSRIIALASLNGFEREGALIDAIRVVPLVDGEHDVQMGLAAFNQAATLEVMDDPAEREHRIQSGAAPLEAFRAAAAATSDAFLLAGYADLTEAGEELAALDKLLNERCGTVRAPSTTFLREAISEAMRAILSLGGERPAIRALQGVEATATASKSAGPEEIAPGAASGPISSREEAFQRITEAADFFRRTEPHSVLAWQLDECVRWGKMSLPDLLRDLIPDASARGEFYRRVGIPRAADE
jgi:type VI secretion system protein ImpA